MAENLHKGHRERVKKRYLREGLDSFADHQVLEMLLFYCYPMKDTNETAHRMIKEYGSLHHIFEADPLEISRRCGVTEHAAVLISMIPSLARRYQTSRWDEKVILDSTEKAGKFAVNLFTGRKGECLFLICLNNRNQLINAAVLSEGTIGQAPLYTREAAEIVIKYQAAAVIMAHNHPGGALKPSPQDTEATKKIAKALTAIDVNLLDHIIAAGDQYYSFSENKAMPVP